jgi:hypothetical protein
VTRGNMLRPRSSRPPGTHGKEKANQELSDQRMPEMLSIPLRGDITRLAQSRAQAPETGGDPPPSRERCDAYPNRYPNPDTTW